MARHSILGGTTKVCLAVRNTPDRPNTSLRFVKPPKVIDAVVACASYEPHRAKLATRPFAV